MAKLITDLFRALVLRTVTATWNFVRRHPWLSLAVVVFIFVLPYLAPFAALWSLLMRFKSWVEDVDGETTFTGRVIRRAILFVVLALLPGGFFLWLSLKGSVWLWREKNSQTEFELST